MIVHVGMLLGQMQPHTDGHQHPCHYQRRGDSFVKQQQGQRRAEKRRHGKVRPSPRGAKMTQRDDEKHQTYTVARKTEYSGGTYGRRSRYRCARCQRNHEIGGARHQSLDHGDEGCVIQRYFACEIVVESPAEACPHDGQR